MTWNPAAPKQHTTCTPLDTRGPKRLWDAPAGWVTRQRSSAGGTRKLEFCCPVHGQFTVEVPRGEDPDEMPCPQRYEPREFAMFGADAEERERIRAAHVCGLASPWSPTTFGIWASSGEVTG